MSSMFDEALQSFRRKLEVAQYGGLPNFIILGAQKAGTTALYDYISQHPGVFPSKIKEVHFFDRPKSRYKGTEWYRSHFASNNQKEAQSNKLGYRVLCGEATGAYLFHPLVPGLISQFCLDFAYKPKFLVILRNPIERALSHYAHNCRVGGRENLSFHDAVFAEDARISEDLAKLKKNPQHHPSRLLTYSYIRRGLYMQQISRWLEHFNKEDFLFICSDDLKRNPIETMTEVFSYLDLPLSNLEDVKPRHVGQYEKQIDSKVLDFLISQFETDANHLFRFLGRQIWKFS